MLPQAKVVLVNVGALANHAGGGGRVDRPSFGAGFLEFVLDGPHRAGQLATLPRDLILGQPPVGCERFPIAPLVDGPAQVGRPTASASRVSDLPAARRRLRSPRFTSASSHTIRRRTMTDRSIARTEGQSGYGSGHHPPAPTGVMERPRQAGGSCSQSG